MNKQELIKKLKDPERAQPFYMRSREEQEILKAACPDGLLWVNRLHFPNWRGTTVSAVAMEEVTYILKPDYQPEPGHVNIEVVAGIDGQFVLKEHYPGIEHDYDYLWWAYSHEDFVGFFADAGTPGERPVDLGNVPTLIREGHKVYARFVKDVE